MKKLKRKGSIADIFYIATFMFLMAIVISVGWLINSSINAEWQTKDNLGTTSKEIMQDSNDNYVAMFDNLYLVMFVGLYIGSLILAYNVDINPLYLFLSLFILGVIVTVTAVFGNAWYEIGQNAVMGGYIDDFTFIPFIMENYVKVFVVMAFGLMGVMYAKIK